MPIPPWLLAWLMNPRLWIGAGVIAVAAAGALYVHTLQGALAQARAKAAAAQVVAAVASGQGAAAQSAAAIAQAGAQRAALDITVHQENDHAIQAAPGASAPLAASVNRVGRDGLCRYDAYAADPACAGLRGDHPAVLPPAGGGDPAAAP